MQQSRRKVGVLTFHFVCNYGAILQTYGLCQALKELGVCVEVINYEGFKAYKLRWWNGWGIGTRSIKGIKDSISFRQRKILKQKKIGFFVDKLLPLSRKISSKSSLKHYAKKNFSHIIVGSDQVWNYYVTDKSLAEVYYLDFYDGRKISYAASFGQPQPAEYSTTISSYLMDFDNLSVRDEFSLEIVSGLINREMTITCDPTFLVDFSVFNTKSVMLRSLPDRFILVYNFGKHQNVIKAALQVKGVLGLPLVAVGEFGADYADVVFDAAGIEEWLILFEKADFICTHSFHGVIFSLKNKKEFLAVEEDKKPNWRVRDIADRYGFSDRIISSMQDCELRDIVLTTMQYDPIEEQISKHVAFSYQYLKDSLK